MCRCEDVTVAELESALAAGMQTIEEIKRYTGLGTGPCQGKECLAALVRWLHTHEGRVLSELQPFTARPPAEPVTFGALAGPRESAGRDKP